MNWYLNNNNKSETSALLLRITFPSLYSNTKMGHISQFDLSDHWKTLNLYRRLARLCQQDYFMRLQFHVRSLIMFFFVRLDLTNTATITYYGILRFIILDFFGFSYDAKVHSLYCTQLWGRTFFLLFCFCSF